MMTKEESLESIAVNMRLCGEGVWLGYPILLTGNSITLMFTPSDIIGKAAISL